MSRTTAMAAGLAGAMTILGELTTLASANSWERRQNGPARPDYVTRQNELYETQQRLTKNLDYKLCQERGWSTGPQIATCDQMLNSLSQLRDQSDACFSSRDWDCVVRTSTGILQIYLPDGKTGMYSPDAKTYFQMGRAYLEQKAYPRSIMLLRAAQRLQPENQEVAQSLSLAEQAQQSVQPIKTDIRGFSPGMTIEQWRAQIGASTRIECAVDQSKTSVLPCFDSRFNVLRLSTVETLSFAVTRNLSENRLSSIEYKFVSSKPYEELYSAVKDQLVCLMTNPQLSGVHGFYQAG